MLDLKNCPFCGGSTFRRYTEDTRHLNSVVTWHHIRCDATACAAEMRYPSEEGVIAAWNRRALQAVGPEPAVAVKPLEWAFRDTKISDDLSVWVARAEGLDFTYSIWGSTNENATAAFTVPKLHNGFFDTLESAKAAAEADYASRIRSALVATPPAERVVEADAEPANCISFDTKDRLVGALRTAIDHIEHMSAFLSKLQAGYSFEGIGEDMPNLRDALASATSSDVTKYPAGVSSRDHIAHDMKIGRFPRQSSIDTFLRERALATKPAVKDDETVVEALHNAEYICDRWEKNQGINSLTIAVRSLLAALAAKDGRS